MTSCEYLRLNSLSHICQQIESATRLTAKVFSELNIKKKTIFLVEFLD